MFATLEWGRRVVGDSMSGDGSNLPVAGDGAASQKAQAEADKAGHEAEKARVEAAKAQAELEEWRENAERRKRDAAAATETAELANEEKRLANLGTQRTWLSDLGPDLDEVKRGSTTTDGTIFGSLLTTRALRDAAAATAKTLTGRGLAGATKVLVTSDPALVQRLASYRGLVRHLTIITGHVDHATTSAPPDPGGGSYNTTGLGTVLAGLGSAAAKTLPGLLSLISANRTVKSVSAELDELTVVIAVAGALVGVEPSLNILMDETRLISAETEVETKFGALQAKATDLGIRIGELEPREDEPARAWLKEAKLVLQTAQEALRALTAVPAESKLSPLAAASAQAIFADADLKFVLVVKPAGASTTQLVSDRPLAMKDPFHVVADAGIAYTLIATSDSHVAIAGIATGEASMVGRIGSTLELDPS